MGSIFVTKSDTIDESFYIAQDPVFEEWHFGDTIEEVKHNMFVFAASHHVVEGLTAEEIHEKIKNFKETDLRPVKVKFRRPDFGTNLQIIGQAVRLREGSEVFDPELYVMLRLAYLLVDWDITDQKDGEKIPLSTEVLRMLHPNIVRGILNKLDKHIPHYRDF
jgi:hypothetical protein